MKVSPSGYYAYLKRQKRHALQEDRKLLTRIKRIFTLHNGTMGAKRIAKKLSQSGKPEKATKQSTVVANKFSKLQKYKI